MISLVRAFTFACCEKLGSFYSLILIEDRRVCFGYCQGMSNPIILNGSYCLRQKIIVSKCVFCLLIVDFCLQSLDAQLRQMTDDLGKVIEHLNTNAKPWQPNDPVALVARILSAHMDTLKWVDQNTTLLSQKMEEVARVAANAGKRGKRRL